MTEKSKSSVGFIGIGNMGWPMAENIQKAGYQVTVYDLDSARCADFAQKTGAGAASDLREVAEADIVITMLPTSQIVHNVLVKAQDGAFINHAKSGALVIDMSSSEPTDTRELGKVLKEKGLYLLDAPVSGGMPRAETGTLTIMVGGDDPQAIARAEPVLQTMGERLFLTGDLGTGHAVKALNNYIAAATYVATAESLLIAKRFGLDPETLIDIVGVSTGQSFVSDFVMKQHVVNEKYATGFGLGLLAKDVRIASNLGKDVKLDAPLSRLVEDRWQLARDRVGLNADHSEAIKGWDDNL